MSKAFHQKFGYGAKSLQDAIKAAHGKPLTPDQAKSMVDTFKKKHAAVDFEVIENKHMPHGTVAMIPKGMGKASAVAVGLLSATPPIKNYAIQSAMVDASMSLKELGEKFQKLASGVTSAEAMITLDSIPPELQQLLAQKKLTATEFLGMGMSEWEKEDMLEAEANAVQSIAAEPDLTPSTKKSFGHEVVDHPTPPHSYVPVKPDGHYVLERLRRLGFEGNDAFITDPSKAPILESHASADKHNIETTLDLVEKLVEEAAPLTADLAYACYLARTSGTILRQMRNEFETLRNHFQHLPESEQKDMALGLMHSLIERNEIRAKTFEAAAQFTKSYDLEEAKNSKNRPWRKRAWQKVTMKDGEVVKTTLCQTEPSKKVLNGEYVYAVPEGTVVRQVWIVSTPQSVGL
ncbi:hypothetical protein DLP3_073 [Stenotrophomonas phage vB_SmaS_DLP_3]|nr:hypothetical protein DLP3_073 [Stenotrophomonas phage vB_SmaS_DLP_3]